MSEMNKSIEESMQQFKYVVKNLEVPYKSGVKIIDYVVITKAGICMVLLEEGVGKIYGNMLDKNWTRVSRSKENILVNPVRESNDYKIILDSIFVNLSQNKYNTFIVYKDRADVSNIDIKDNIKCSIVKESKLEASLLEYPTKNAKVFDAKTMKLLYEYLMAYTKLSVTEKKEYIQKIQCKKSGNSVINNVEKKYLKNTKVFSEESRSLKLEVLNKKALENLYFTLLGLLMLFVSVFTIIVILSLSKVWLFVAIGVVSLVATVSFSFIVRIIKEETERIENIKLTGNCPYCDNDEEISQRKLVYACDNCKCLYYIDQTK